MFKQPNSQKTPKYEKNVFRPRAGIKPPSPCEATGLTGVFQYTLHSNIINAPYMIAQVQFWQDSAIC